MMALRHRRPRRTLVALLGAALLAASGANPSRGSDKGGDTIVRTRRTAAVGAPPAQDDGYRLWLRYEPLPDGARRREYLRAIAAIVVDGAGWPEIPRGTSAPVPPMPQRSLTLQAAGDELATGLSGLLGRPIPVVPGRPRHGRGTVVLGTPRSSAAIASLNLGAALRPLGDEGYLLVRRREQLIVAANTDRGALYGVFALLRHLQTLGSVRDLDVRSAPAKKLRMLDHWDNLDGTVERGYAGRSLWDWAALPDRLDGRYRDYARAMASVGLNAAALNNVNADARILTPAYLRKVAALATVFRPYGIQVFLAGRFSAPRDLGGLATADPQDLRVAAWWRNKADEIYKLVPDFGGFLVKANSEGQPGPQEYGRTHAEGANVLAEAVAPHGGMVIWRGFVYDHRVPDDRAKQAYAEFKPLDGAFRSNALVQLKNGPIDFQPREPFHPLLGAMPRTSLVLELQITQEYLGFASHLVFLAPLFKEALDSDTYAAGPGSTVGRIVAGIAGVANIGSDRNWCGHPFAQANWYAFGRLAWDPGLEPARLASEWLRMTFTNDERFIAPVQAMMLASRQAAVDYMTPLGLHHLMAKDHHHGPGPWVGDGRPDWTAVYYHRADEHGIGFDRTATGTNAVSQYHDPWPARFSDLATCPESLLLWFHHLPWDYRMASGRSLWDELCLRYQRGVEAVHAMQRTWDSLDRSLIDGARFEQVRTLLRIQEAEARWWRDASILYFQQFAKRPFPQGVKAPAESLDYYRRLTPEQVAASVVSPGR